MSKDKISDNIFDRINQLKQTGENKFFNSLKNSTKNKSGKFFSTELSEIAENHKEFGYNNYSGENSKILDNKKDKNKKIKNELKYEANKNTILYKKELQMRQPTFLKIANQNYSLSNANTYSPNRSKMREITLNKKKHTDLISTSLILPQVNIREISVETLPEKIDIYSKIKIRDIIGLAKLKNSRPPFK
jgi:parvulin-like peptidyl-prolyl isomerase